MITPAVMVNMPLHNSEKGTELTFTHPHDQNQANSTVACAFAASREYPHRAFNLRGHVHVHIRVRGGGPTRARFHRCLHYTVTLEYNTSLIVQAQLNDHTIT